MTKYVANEKIFHTIVVHSEPPKRKMKKKKNKNNWLLMNFNSRFTETYLKKTIAASKIKPLVALVGGFQPLTVSCFQFTKNSRSCWSPRSGSRTL